MITGLFIAEAWQLLQLEFGQICNFSMPLSADIEASIGQLNLISNRLRKLAENWWPLFFANNFFDKNL